jgi:4-methylaminobutanoate oxidase (formaldehyde-forming)
MVAGAPVIAVRITFVGELGWELHVPSEYMLTVFDALQEAGKPFEMANAGYRTIDSLRLEKGYRVWAGDIGPDYTPFEAGLGFAVAMKSNKDFIGRDALERQRAGKLTKRLAAFAVRDPAIVLHGRETIFRDAKRVGWTTSAGYGHTIGAGIALGYVRNEAGVDKDYLLGGSYELEVRTRRVPATIHLEPLYDPTNARIKG